MGNCDHLLKLVKIEKSKLCKERLLFKKITAPDGEKDMGQGLCSRKNSQTMPSASISRVGLSEFCFYRGESRKGGRSRCGWDGRSSSQFVFRR